MHQLIVNPTAGGGRAARALPALQAGLVSQGIEHSIHHTNAPGHAEQLARALPKTDPVIVVGGDGTINEVLNGLWNGSCVPQAVGIVPLGTGDDFARGAGLPLNQPAQSLEIILRGHLHEFDLGLLQNQNATGRIFLNGLGSGFDAQVGRTVKRTPTFLPGPLRYLLAIFAELAALKQRQVRVFVDDACVYDGAALLVAVMNLKSYGGGLRVAPNALGDDGLLDVVVGGRFSKLGTLAILPRLQRGTHLGHGQVKSFRGATVRLQWAEINEAHCDGEMLAPGTEFSAKLVQKAVKIFMPKSMP